MELGKNIQQREGFKAFIPHPFPPKDGFRFKADILKKSEQATRLLGKLDGITRLLPDMDFFLSMYVRKDATDSSQIEGTQATIIDAIEASGGVNTNVPRDVDDILHYIEALNYGMKRLTEDNFPVSLRFVRELHQKLMVSARSTHFCDPGEFRKSQNWIGGVNPGSARFVPPPASELNRALKDLENFIHADDGGVLTIIKAGLIHAQFETIHPFLDGNGRTGRMLIMFYLWQEGFLDKPILFLSSFFNKYRDLYYERLAVYHLGKVDEWTKFFLDGVIDTANAAIETVRKITALREEDIFKLQKLGKRASESAALVLPKLYGQPVINVSTLMKWTGFTRAGAQQVINRFIEMGILLPKDEDERYGQSYIYKKYTDIFTNSDNGMV